MSAKREKRRRQKERFWNGGYNGKMERAIKEWKAAEPPKWMLLSWVRWYRRDPRERRDPRKGRQHG